ncbi:MAG TPA: hypothetical protein VJB11_01985 [archaeon]|nr:hypothetical protein [archaeon]
MKPIGLINWDVDNVWYKGISTSHCAEKSMADPRSYLDGFVEKKWFSYDDVKNWQDSYNGGKEIITIKELAQCLTDFLYKMKKDDSSIITKEQTIEGKQSLLKGMTIKEVRKMADSIPYTDGLFDAVRIFKENSLYQVAFSDGLWPFVCYKTKQLGMRYSEGVPTIIEENGTEKKFKKYMVNNNEIKLTGKVGKFSKFDAFKNHMKGRYSLCEAVLIDDSSANAKSMKEVMENGGLAVAFNPTDAHRKEFNSLSIPILKGNDLRPFIEIVKFPSEIGKYCE